METLDERSSGMEVPISLAVEKLTRLVAECDKMIALWHRICSEGVTSDDEVEEVLMLATEAWKDKRRAEAALAELLT